MRDGRAHLLDVDTDQTVLTLPVSAVIDLGYMVQSRQLFYLTENSIVSTGLDGGNKTQVCLLMRASFIDGSGVVKS